MVEAGFKKAVWTIGHSTRTLDDFIAILRSFEITLVADIRSLPGSRRYPHFNSDELRSSLGNAEIAYIHLKALGGRRKTTPQSHNTGWRNPSFRGYADYMETDGFVTGIKELEILSSDRRTAIMCSEAVWWRCHRSLVSDYLTFHQWKVIHILGLGKSNEHHYTGPAKIIGSQLTYGA